MASNVNQFSAFSCSFSFFLNSTERNSSDPRTQATASSTAARVVYHGRPVHARICAHRGARRFFACPPSSVAARLIAAPADLSARLPSHHASGRLLLLHRRPQLLVAHSSSNLPQKNDGHPAHRVFWAIFRSKNEGNMRPTSHEAACGGQRTSTLSECGTAMCGNTCAKGRHLLTWVQIPCIRNACLGISLEPILAWITVHNGVIRRPLPNFMKIFKCWLLVKTEPGCIDMPIE